MGTAGGVNLYAYTANPLTVVDLDGLSTGKAHGGTSDAKPKGKGKPKEQKAKKAPKKPKPKPRARVSKRELKKARKAQKRAAKEASSNPRKYRKKVVAANDATTLSGWDTKKNRAPDKFYRGDDVAPNPMKDHYRDIMGKDPPPAGRLDHGNTGATYATHAEKQLARRHQLTGTNKPIGVSKEMCGDCREWFRQHAISSKQRQVVADPSRTRVFHPDGHVDVYDPNGKLLRTVGPNEAPAASTSAYSDIDW